MPKNHIVRNKLHYYIAYSLPCITTAWLIAPLGVVQGIYAKYFGLSLTTIAIVILCARFIDAISDPLVGYFSDYHYRRTGTRKPFVLFGGLLFIISSYFLYVPFGVDVPVLLNTELPNNIATVSTSYFAFWFIAFMVAWTLFEIPHITWASEIAPKTDDKAKVYSLRSASSYLGLLLFFSIPMLPVFGSPDISPSTLKISVVTAAFFLLLLLGICLIVAPDRFQSSTLQDLSFSHLKSFSVKKKVAITKLDGNIRLLIKNILANTPFSLFIAAYLFSFLGAGMWNGLIFIYVDGYLGLGEQFASMFTLAYIVAILVTPLWYRLAVVLGKKTTWFLAMIIMIMSFIYTGILDPSDTKLADLVIIKVMNILGFACIGVIGPAMVSEISDYGTLKSGDERSAIYFSFFAFFAKSGGAVAAALGLGIAGWYGFDVSSTEHSAHSILGLTFAIAWLPVFFTVVALIFILLTPINTHRHTIIRRRLDAQIAKKHTFE